MFFVRPAPYPTAMSGVSPTDMFPPESIQVLENTHAKVVILDPPYYSFGTWILFLATCALVIGVVLVVRDVGTPFALLPFVIALVLALFGSYLATKKTTYTFSREDGLLRIQKQVWGRNRPETALRISDIRRATVETDKFSHILIIVLNSGESFSLGDGSNRQGYYGAADAINDFLGAPRER